MFQVRLQFSASLHPLLYARSRQTWIVRRLAEKTTTKDLIESCGVPHTEVDLILAAGRPVGFAHPIEGAIDLSVHAFDTVPQTFAESRLQLPDCDRFVADGHLGKLARQLRLLGIDVAYSPQIDDHQLLRIMQDEQRGVLTRDRRLLMHNVVKTGYCPRSDNAEKQATEVLSRFRLDPERLNPFTRCLRCNGLLQPVEKRHLEAQLEPLTRQHYNVFHQCTTCGHIYWEGSHASKLRALIDRLINGSAAHE